MAPIRTTAGTEDVEEEVEDAGAEVVIVEEEEDDKEKIKSARAKLGYQDLCSDTIIGLVYV